MASNKPRNYGVVVVVIFCIFVSLSLNQYNGVTVGKDATITIPFVSFEEVTSVNESLKSENEDFQQHPLFAPSIRHPNPNKPQIVLTKKYKQYLNEIQRLVKGFLTKVTKVNQSVKGFFSKFKKQNPKKKQHPEPKQPSQPTSMSSNKKVRLVPSPVEPKANKPLFVNDHVEMDIRKLTLTSTQIETLHKAHQSVLEKSDKYNEWAAETQLVLSPHLAYRYYVSVDWSDTYNEQSVDKAIIETIQWRRDFGIGSIDTTRLSGLVAQGLAYTSPVPDKHGRAVIYLKIGAFSGSDVVDEEAFLNLVMYTVERADRMSVESGSGEFVTLIDFEGFSWTRCPPIAYLQKAIVLLRMHYPYRLAGIYILNAGSAFHFVWQLIKPLLPKKALQKTIMMSRGESAHLLANLVGRESLEVTYGGVQPEVNQSNVEHYFATGFWARNAGGGSAVKVERKI